MYGHRVRSADCWNCYKRDWARWLYQGTKEDEVNIFTWFPSRCCSLLEKCANFSLVENELGLETWTQADTCPTNMNVNQPISTIVFFYKWISTSLTHKSLNFSHFKGLNSNKIFPKFFSLVPQNMCRRLQTSSLPGVHHRPLHGVPASCSSETLPQHAAVHLWDTVKEGNPSSLLQRGCVKNQFWGFFCLPF